MTEDDLLRGHGVDPGSLSTPPRKPSTPRRTDGTYLRQGWVQRARPIIILPPASSHLCPGDGKRGCLTQVPDGRLRCRFCERTVRAR